MARSFADLIDLHIVRPLLQSFSRTSGLPMAIIDREGRVLATSGWQKLCTFFHRRIPLTLQRCIESDTDFSGFTRDGRPPAPGDFFESRCSNGLAHIGLPIVVEGEILATLFLSQFFYEPPDLEHFRRQATEFSLDEGPYLEAVRKVPIFSRSQVGEVLGFYSGLARLMANMATERLRQLEAQKELEASERKFRSIFESALDSIVLVAADGRILEANEQTCTNLGYDRDELLRLHKSDFHDPSERERIAAYIAQVMAEGEARMETEQRRKDGSSLPVEISGRRVDFMGEPAVLCLTRDMTERRRAEATLKYRMALEELIATISTRFVNLAPVEVDGAILEALRQIGEFLGADRSYVFLFGAGGMSNTHEWCAPGTEPQQHRLQNVPPESLPWFLERIRGREVVYCPSVADLGPEAEAEKGEWQAQDILSLVCVPMIFEDRILGFLGLDAVHRPMQWPEDSILLLRMVGESFAGALVRRRSEEALRESEERFRSIFHSAAVGMATVSVGGAFTEVNPALCRFLGYGAEELLSLTVDDITYPADLAKSREAVQRALRGDSEGFELEKRYIRKDGRICWGLVSGVCTRDCAGRPLHCVVQIQDISARKDAETHLRQAFEEAEEAREKIDAILKSVVDGLFVTDLFDRIILMNEAAQRLLSVSLNRTALRHMDNLLPEPGLRQQILASRKEDAEKGPYEWELPRGEGGVLILQARSMPVRSGEGGLTGTITLLRDTTREREFDRMKDEFIATAAHELRTPLTTVMGFVELLLRPDDPFSPEEKREFLREIYQKSEVLTRLIEDLLDLSRIRSGHLVTLKKSQEDLAHLVARAVRSFQGMSEKHAFRLQFPEGPVLLFVDAGKIGQVLENLLSNAVKFSPAGGTIEVRGERTDGEFQVTVADEGVGMRPEQLERIFEKFYRVDASNTAVSGLGLGMNIARSIVEAHGGRIWVESRFGRGTRAHFTLPLDDNQEGLP